MKKTLKKVITLTCCIFVLQFSKAQDFGEIIAGGAKDASTYLEAYTAPFINSFGVGMAGGWYNTAKPHKFLGFDAGFTISMAAIPDDETTFKFDASKYTSFQYTGSSSDELPTLVGGGAPNEKLFIPASTVIDIGGGQTLEIKDQIEFDVPGGFDPEKDFGSPIVGAPVPMVQASVGLFKSTDLILRGLPYTQELESGDGSIYELSLFGWGIKHDFKQWIPGMKLLPFDLSALFGTTTMTIENPVTVDNTQTGPNFTTTFQGEGNSEFSATATTFQVIASKKLLMLTPYVGVGINNVKTSIKVTGDFDYTVEDNLGLTSQTATIKDPIDLDFSGSGGPRFTAGLRLKILVLTAHVEYTSQKYQTITAGVGVALR